MSLLRIERLNKAYGSLAVTRDVTLTIEHGERHVIIGPNGAGKTSLINQLGGQIRADSGSIFMNGTDITHAPPEARLKHGICRTFQKNTLFQGLSVFENVRLGIGSRYGQPFNLFARIDGNDDLNRRTWAILARTELEHVAGQRVASLSYGDQRRIEVAAALAGEPKLLLLDEPTSGLSPAETQQMIGFIRTLPDDLSIIMIEHDMEVVFQIAHRISVLYYGEVLMTGAPDEVSGNERVREVYLGAGI